ncbi:MAG: methyltransferase [Planctomycetes bacterium]|nr:methyltransferase [Planctomycetota bacterium]
MNSRERVLCALNHNMPDRLPIDLGGTRQSGIHASAYHQLKLHLGLQSPTRVFDLYQMLAEVERPVMERFGADVVGLYRPEVAFGIRNERWTPWRMFDGTPIEAPGGFAPLTEADGSLLLTRGEEPIARMPKDGFYFDRIEKYPGAAHVDLGAFHPPLLTAETCAHYRAQSRALYEQTEFAVVAPLGPPYELFYGLGTGGFDAWMITLATEPDYVHALYEKLVDAWIENLRRFTDAVEDRVQVLQFCDDFGMQTSLLLSVQMFRRLIMPHYQRGLAWIKRNTSMKIMLHSDGAVYPLIPSLIEMGVEILNPVQTSAAGMDPGRLKQEFGQQLVFWGGSLDCQQTLPYGTADEVAAEVRRHVKAFAPAAGYVFAPVHNIQAGVPPENIVAMFDAARQASWSI